jgi:hypothetical protein
MNLTIVLTLALILISQPICGMTQEPMIIDTSLNQPQLQSDFLQLPWDILQKICMLLFDKCEPGVETGLTIKEIINPGMVITDGVFRKCWMADEKIHTEACSLVKCGITCKQLQAITAPLFSEHQKELRDHVKRICYLGLEKKYLRYIIKEKTCSLVGFKVRLKKLIALIFARVPISFCTGSFEIDNKPYTFTLLRCNEQTPKMPLGCICFRWKLIKEAFQALPPEQKSGFLAFVVNEDNEDPVDVSELFESEYNREWNYLSQTDEDFTPYLSYKNI